MKKIIFTGLFLGSFTIFAEKPTPKNFLIFLVDDLGWQDVSLPFTDQKTPWNSLYRTPNLEKLAARGVKFTHAYANQNCTPTRVSLLTGMNALAHHVTSWTFQKDKNPDEGGDPKFEVPAWNMNGLSPFENKNSLHATSIASILAENGYATIHAGKAHFGAYGSPGEDPKLHGFQINIGGSAAGQPASYSGLQNFGNNIHGGPNDIRAVPHLHRFWGKDIHLTEALTQETMRVMDSVLTHPKPFFLLFSNYAVHTPIQPDKRFVQHYYDLGIDSTEAKYASMVEGMDKSLGDWMTFLDQKKLTENTVIIFLSDNGGLTDVGRGKKGRNTYNTPLRSGKTSGYEGGLRIPFVISGVGRKGRVNHENIIVEDIFPSILQLSHIKSKSVIQQVDGNSLLPIIQEKRNNRNRFFTWHHPHMRTNGSPDVQPFSAIRQGDWKLLFFHKNQHFELYNTQTDLSEKNNLFTSVPEKGQFLAKILGEKLRNSNSKMLIDKEKQKEIIYPF